MCSCFILCVVQWLREDFISYLEEWKKSVDASIDYIEQEEGLETPI